MYSVQIDQDLAKRLTRDGATLLLLDVPAGTVIGIDQQVNLLIRTLPIMPACESLNRKTLLLSLHCSLNFQQVLDVEGERFIYSLTSASEHQRSIID